MSSATSPARFCGMISTSCLGSSFLGTSVDAAVVYPGVRLAQQFVGHPPGVLQSLERLLIDEELARHRVDGILDRSRGRVFTVQDARGQLAAQPACLVEDRKSV